MKHFFQSLLTCLILIILFYSCKKLIAQEKSGKVIFEKVIVVKDTSVRKNKTKVKIGNASLIYQKINISSGQKYVPEKGGRTLVKKAESNTLLRIKNKKSKGNLIMQNGGEVKTLKASGNIKPQVYNENNILASPNLTPYKPSTWSDKIVISNVTGATSDAATIYTDEEIYIDWAVINNGSVATGVRFYVALLIDGTEVTRWYKDPPLNINYYVYVYDKNIGMLPAGTHTFQIIADVTNAIAELDETDNTYSRNKLIVQSGDGTANLTPYKPSGWDDKIVLSFVRGTTTDAATIYTSDSVFVDWALINNGTAATGVRFYIALQLDGTEVTRWHLDPPLNSNYIAYVTDYKLGTLSEGTHTFQVIADVTNTIAESDEADNTYSRSKTVTGGSGERANLTPYQPPGWSDKIVISNIPGTNTDVSTFYDDDNIFIDWAMINSGSAPTDSALSVDLYIDSVIIRYNILSKLNPGQYGYITDYKYGKLSAGSHKVKIVVDAFNKIAESNESDNIYSKTVSVLLNNNPKLFVTPTNLSLSQSLSQLIAQNAIPSHYDSTLIIHAIDENYIKRKFVDKNGVKVMEIIVPGKPPINYRNKPAKISASAVMLDHVPAYDWSFGCSATSGAMIAGYYDNHGYINMYTGPTNNGLAPMNNSAWGTVEINGETRSQCPLSATRLGVDGRTTRGNVDDYWVKYMDCGSDPYQTNGWTQHEYGDCTADFMKTSQHSFLNCDGGTTFWFGIYGNKYISTIEKDGCYGLKQFFESRGYAVDTYYNQLIYGYNNNTQGFTFTDFQNEIDAGRPVLINVVGHTMLGVGYDASNYKIYIHDTWDYLVHEMNWGGTYSDLNLQHYGVGVFHLAPLGQQNVFTLQNFGNANLTISSLTSNKNWLSTSGYISTPLTITAGGSKQVTVNVDWNQIQTSTDNGIITISSNDPAQSQVTVSVVVNKDAQAVLVVSPDTTNVSSNSGTTTFDVSNTGSGTMNWTASVTGGSSWLSIIAGASGTNAGTITASYISNTTASSRTGTIQVTAAGATGSPKNVSVIQEGVLAPVLSVTPDYREVGSSSGSTTFDVSNTGSGTMNWTAVSNSSWITITSGASGTNNGTININYSENTGVFRTGTITVTAAGATGNPKNVEVRQSGQTHFQTVWTGSPYQAMNMFLESATLEGNQLAAGDEIGIYDGSLCVGAVKLTGAVVPYVEIKTSADNPVTTDLDGFTSGHNILYKLWKKSAQQEMSSVTATYNPSTPVPTFTFLGTAYVNLAFQTSIQHNVQIPVNTWYLFSSYVIPANNSMETLLQPLITNIVKVQDEDGNAILKFPNGQWHYGFTTLSSTEGYYIYVNQASTLSLIGQPINLPFSIPLYSSKWNIISWPSQNQQNALNTVNSLITQNKLNKVQDYQGNSIVRFPNGTWNNSIGNFKPGEGYYVNVSSDVSLTISQNPTKIASKLIEKRELSFYKEYSNDKKYMPMNIFILDLDESISEVAAFNYKGQCFGVAAAIIDTSSVGRFAEVVVTMDDPLTEAVDGFAKGEKIYLKAWDGIKELQLNSHVNKGGNLTFESRGTSFLYFNKLSEENSIPTDYMVIRNYPNPFNPSTTIIINLPEEEVISLVIYNTLGEEVDKIVYNQAKSPGIYKFIWNAQRRPSGVYICVLRTNSKSIYNKMMLMK